MTTRVEVNFLRLLNRCEAMAGAERDGDWRLEKYVGALQEQLSDIRKLHNKPSKETLLEYSKKVEFLKGLIEAEKKDDISEKVLIADQLVTNTKVPTNNSSRGLHLQTKAKYHKEMRDDLLSKPTEEKDGVRQRKPGSTEDDIDSVLRYHNQMQEKLAEEMVYFARNLKDNALAANRIVKDDTSRLQDSTKQADTNYSKLKKESERLDTHVQKSCNWWIWAMLVVVVLTFIWMVIFMKMFPKR